MKRKYNIGDRVVYAKRKFSNHPTPRAEHVSPAMRGEGYEYDVDKYWTVDWVEGTTVHASTRTGKMVTFSTIDPRGRKAHWWELLTKKQRARWKKSS